MYTDRMSFGFGIEDSPTLSRNLAGRSLKTPEARQRPSAFLGSPRRDYGEEESDSVRIPHALRSPTW